LGLEDLTPPEKWFHVAIIDLTAWPAQPPPIKHISDRSKNRPGEKRTIFRDCFNARIDSRKNNYLTEMNEKNETVFLAIRIDSSSSCSVTCAHNLFLTCKHRLQLVSPRFWRSALFAAAVRNIRIRRL
jgi:hypothetical protein